MRSDAGVVLVSVMLLLAFLALAGGALLSTTTLDTLVAGNYVVHTRLRFLAESAVREGREQLRSSGNAFSSELLRAAGPDQLLETSHDLASLLASDDTPLLQGVDDPSLPGAVPADWYVFLRNDVADGASAVADSNGLVTLVAIARSGDRTHIVEADVVRRTFPIAAAVTLNGPVGTIGAGSAGPLRLNGVDSCGRSSRHALGVITNSDLVLLAAEIPPARYVDYSGTGPLPDLSNVAVLLPGSVRTVAGLEAALDRLALEATDRLPGGAAIPGNQGAPGNPRLVVVDGDAVLGSGTGYGILVVRGKARVQDGFRWNGLVLVVGQGRLYWNALGEVYGAVFVARTRDQPTAQEPLGPVRASLGGIVVDFSSGGGGVVYDSCALEEADRVLVPTLAAFRED